MRSLLLLVLLGCSSGGSSLPDLAGADLAGADLRAIGDLASPTGDLAGSLGSPCSDVSECRLYSNNCDGCLCQALRTDEVDPVCNGNFVSCFVDPCDGKSAACSAGHCTVQ